MEPHPYRFDGLRFDATQNIYDDGEGEHILAAMARAAREAAPGRTVYLVAENEPQETQLVSKYGFDALWNDDYHHTAAVALTGRREAYYQDYRGTPQELISCAKWGYLYQGQYYSWQKQRRGTPAFGLPAHAFVSFLENHDQVANSGRGKRVHQLTSPGRLRAMTALTLLGPAVPMLFQGQEWGSPSPFLYFADHKEELRHLVKNGRKEFLHQFRTLACAEMPLDDPGDPRVFERCKLDWESRDPRLLALHRDLLSLRRSLSGRVDGAVLSDRAFFLRWLEADRLLFVNLGPDLHLDVAPEPLLAPPAGASWELLWSSEHPSYGGCGTPPPEDEQGRFHVLGECAVLLAPKEGTQ
jgi:maltooligosyltrehalose trehalohydrolase